MFRTSDTKVTVSGCYIGETAKAVRFAVDTVNGVPLDKARYEWFPLSQIDKIHKVPADGKDPEAKDWLLVSEWICKQKNMLGLDSVTEYKIKKLMGSPDNDSDTDSYDIPF